MNDVAIAAMLPTLLIEPALPPMAQITITDTASDARAGRWWCSATNGA
jgi:hypothetical protein